MSTMSSRQCSRPCLPRGCKAPSAVASVNTTSIHTTGSGGWDNASKFQIGCHFALTQRFDVDDESHSTLSTRYHHQHQHHNYTQRLPSVSCHGCRLTRVSAHCCEISSLVDFRGGKLGSDVRFRAGVLAQAITGPRRNIRACERRFL